MAIEVCKANLSHVATVLCDGGYTGENFADEVNKLIDAKVEIYKRSDKSEFVVIPSVGPLSAASAGWKNAGACGKTASEKSGRAIK